MSFIIISSAALIQLRFDYKLMNSFRMLLYVLIVEAIFFLRSSGKLLLLLHFRSGQGGKHLTKALGLNFKSPIKNTYT